MEIILILAAIFLLIAISIAAFVFWIMMLIDSIKRNFKKESEKIVWVLVIILTGILGAIIYYFVDKR